MKDYVIINGVSSKTKTGLAINILPPITKPEMRTLVEEIDGRDGDIITKLGYSAYDKTIEIGLFGNGYDVDDIIAFFNQEGTITFSNEPDKYYNFTTIDEFDIERLLQFKTSTITFHCQPFKYLIDEEPKEIEYQYVTNEGTEITLNNTKNALMQLELTPSELTQETTTGGNIQKFSPRTSSGTYNYVCDDKGQVTITGTISSTVGLSYNLSSNYMSLNSGTYKVKIIGQANNIELQTNNPKAILGAFDSNKEATLTVTEDITNFQIFQYPKVSVTLNENYYITLASGTTATTERYTGGIPQPNPDYPSEVQVIKGNNTITISNSDNSQSQVLPLNLPNGMEYCKIGDYEDEFEHDGDKWYLNKKIGKSIFTGANTESWNYETVSGRNNFYINIPTAKGGNTNQIYNNLGIYQTNIMDYNYSTYISNGKNLNFRYDGITTTNDFKTMLSTHNMIVYYMLETPTHEEITDTTLISQLNAIEQTVSYDEQTNISQTNAGLPFRIKATAMISGSDEVEIVNHGNTYAKPILDIKGNGLINVYLNGTQIFSVNITDEIIVDIANLESYNPNTSALMNRNVTGDISQFIIPTGTNTISVDGAVETVTITIYERWL